MLQKQPVSVPIAMGLDQKSDPYQIPIGKFAVLTNKVFEKTGRLNKRNGFGELAALASETNTLLTTFNGNLTAIGDEINAYSDSSDVWVNKGDFLPLGLQTLSMIRSSTSQISCDSATHSNGLVCVAYADDLPSGTVYRYAVLDSVTSQNVIPPTNLASADDFPRVFVLANYFVVVYAVVNSLRFIAINVNDPQTVTSPSNLSTVYDSVSPSSFDGVVANNRLYIAFNGTDGGGAVRMTYLTSTLAQGSTEVFAGEVAERMTICADNTQPTPVIYVSYWDVSSLNGSVLAVDSNLATVLAPTVFLATYTFSNMASAAQNGVVTIIYEIDNSPLENYLQKITVTQAGVVGSDTNLIRSLGLASKAFILDGVIYCLGVYDSTNQPTYFLITDGGVTIGKLAYSNAYAPNYTYFVSSVTVNETLKTADLSYLLTTTLIPVNKSQGAASSSTVYAQTGINFCRFNFDPVIQSSEIGNNLELSGGFVWGYDGNVAVEQGFHLWPEGLTALWSATGGSIAAKPDGTTNANAYYYVCLYEWTDNQGNIYRSAPSIPVGVTTTGSGTAGSIELSIPTLRVTAKTQNPVKLVAYRWSVAQQLYYQVTSVSVPTLNSTTVDRVQFIDTLADASIIGNSIVYTTGGVIENIGAPATNSMSLFKSRLFLITAENENLLWFSKQVIQGTPVEMSDLLTIFVAPTTGAEGPTGPMRYTAPMDDKLIIFKDNALYYIVGTGPDNTGANNDFSEPVFITSTVGSRNQRSVVFQPNGLMFEADNGIWILKRDLSTGYIGAPVEDYTDEGSVVSAVRVPGTTQVRFSLSSGVTLMYDYYFDQWGVFSGINVLSGTTYERLHTFIDAYGRVFQETPGIYRDGSRPVLINLKTGWINVAGLQGYERAYFFYLLGEYKSPHKLEVGVAYDYNPSPTQTTVIVPTNFNEKYGDDPGNYGDVGPYGGNGSVEKWRVFFKQQKCEAFQLTITESYDPSYGEPAGEGLTLSGLNMIVGVKSGYPRRSAKNSAG